MWRMYGKLAFYLCFCIGISVFSARAQEKKEVVLSSEPEEAADVDSFVAEELTQNTEAVNTPDVSTLQNADGTPQENIAVSPDVSKLPEEKTIDEPELEVVVDVFAPDFMESLINCKPDKIANGNILFTIVGEREKNCHMQYGNYELNVPKTLLSNIHGFDDLDVLVKNRDVASYKYFPKYMYDGLIYALDSCSRKEEYLGLEEGEKLSDASVTRGLKAEYKENTCIIYLQNDLKLDFEDTVEDYGYTCRLPQEAVDELLPYFKDIIAQHNEEDIPLDERPKEVRDADIALMYYLQQNDYCTKNKQQAEGED